MKIRVDKLINSLRIIKGQYPLSDNEIDAIDFAIEEAESIRDFGYVTTNFTSSREEGAIDEITDRLRE